MRFLVKAIGWTGAALTLLAVVALSYRAHAQSRVAETLKLTGPSAIDEARYVTLGGVAQWVQIRGEDSRNPIILVVHGGPGMSYAPFSPFFRSWEKYFTVVQWDRRGVGKTYRRSGTRDSASITFDRLAADGVELADSLIARFKQPKILLLGHSVGSVVGALMALRAPDRFSTYIGTDQMVDMARNERVSYDMLRERARTRGDAKLAADVEHVGPPPYSDVDRWFEKQRLVSATDPIAPGYENTFFKMLATAPGYSIADMMAFGAGLKFSAAALLRELMTFDLRSAGTTFSIPVVVIEGENDVIDPTALAVEWYDSIKAPDKHLVVIKNAGHNAMFMRGDEFLNELLRVRR